MKKLFALAALACASFFMWNSCDNASNSPSSDISIKDGTKIKITYVVESAYFTLPPDVPEYHIYGTDTVLPVPVEKNGLPNLMKAKFWSDGTRDGITVLGARNYTKEIHVEYKYSFDTEKCNDGYIMINGACVAAPNGGMIGEACSNLHEESYDFIVNGIIECGSDFKWQFAGCNNGYNYVNGKCEKANPQCEDGYVLNSKGECEAVAECTMDDTPYCSLDGRVKTCVDGAWVEVDCPEGGRCEGGACVASSLEGIGEACAEVGTTRDDIIDNGIIICGDDNIWQFGGCNEGYIHTEEGCIAYPGDN